MALFAKLVGSISGCIKDFIDGKVKVEDVLFISASTRCEDALDWKVVIESYAKYH